METLQPHNFCGVSERMLSVLPRRRSPGDSSYRWNKNPLTYCIASRLPGVSVDILDEAVAYGFAQWSAITPLEFQQVASTQADFLVLTRRIDGQNGVLAEHQLPPGNDMQLRGWIDMGEQWTLAMLKGVWTHELGHGIGISHTDVPNSLMNAFWNPAIDTPQAWDISAAQGIYGPRRSPVPEPEPMPTPGTTPTGTNFVATINIEKAGIYDVAFTRRVVQP